MATPVGIDDLNIYASTLSVDFAAIAAARGLSAKELSAVQFLRRSVTPPCEDPVTLAVNAARPLVDEAGRGSFGLLIVATESGVDHGKPLSAYVHSYLRLDPGCRNFEVKYACYGGTAAVQLAAAWVRSGEACGKRALVVMTDLARRHVGDPAELSAGSGAVAVSLAAEPRVLEIESRSGYACKEVYDVARPTPTGEWGDAVLSLASYLDLAEGAWDSYRARTGFAGALDQRFRYVLYHTPLVSLVEQAHAVLLERDRDDLGPREARESFERMVRPALRYASELANVYSGSVYCLLAGLVDSGSETDLQPETPVGIFSYGSGACAEFLGGRITAPARTTLERRRIGEHLAERLSVSVELYERLVDETETLLTRSDYRPPEGFVPELHERGYRDRERLVLRSVENHHRLYEWCS
jgi:3-hydroxy-3-methylglutaryl CoA synthase